MPEKIYFGDVIIKNTQTAFTSMIKGVIFTENVKTTDEQIRFRALKHIRATERHKYQVTKICFETAKLLGATIV